MTREDRLYAMRMQELVIEAEKLGIKVNKKGSKAKAVEKILEAEAALLVELKEQAEVVANTESTLSVPMPVEYDENGPHLIEEDEEQVVESEEQVVESEETEKPKKAPKMTWADILSAIPSTIAEVKYTHLKGDRVGITVGNRRLMAIGAGRGGYRIITNKAEIANGFSDFIGGLDWAMTADGRDFVFKAVTQEQMERMVRYAVCQ